MPPKKKDPKAEKGMQKAAEKEKQKIVEDKTFGLKNKNKSKAVQKYIKTVQQQVKGPQKGGEQALIAKKKEEQEQKKKEAQQQALLASLFRGTENVKKIAVDGNSRAGTYDPKTCKESQRIDLFTDQRVQRGGAAGETMEGWDQAQLEDVIRTKHVQHNERNSTAIICKHFLEAVEKKQYGWFWSCPNGGDACIYRHCLPPGYVLKSDLPPEPEQEEELIEVIVERERAALPPGGTPVTLETFLAWKEKQESQRRDAVEAQRVAEAKKGGNKGLHVLSGKDLFQFDPSLFVDDEGAAAEADYEEEDEATREEVAKENQRILDQANRDALEQQANARRQQSRSSEAGSSDDDDEAGENSGKEEKRSKGKREDDGGGSATVGVTAIREDLFLYGDDFDENELENLDN